MGAMENKGLNVFNTRYVLARPETATDTDFQGVEAVIAHEYFNDQQPGHLPRLVGLAAEGLTVFATSSSRWTRAARR